MKLGIAADHGGYDLKEQLIEDLRKTGYEIHDFGAHSLLPDDDYPDYVIPLARSVAKGDIDRGIAICGSGVGACIAANKVRGVRAGLIQDTYSAHQGVEDDNMNVICLGGRVVGYQLAWALILAYLNAEFAGKERFKRRLAEIDKLERQGMKEKNND
jgi:ribose 5-phosphate isomerase B